MRIILIAAFLYSSAISAAVVEVPLPLDYRILAQSLEEQVFTGPDQTAPIYADDANCNTLVLADPEVAGTATGQIRVRSSVQVQAGTPIGGRCLLARSWQGLIETMQVARVDPQSSRLSFQVVDSALLRAGDESDMLPEFLMNWVRAYVHPRLGAVTVDLAPAVSGLQDFLDNLTGLRSSPGQPQVQPPIGVVGLADVRPTVESLIAVLSLDVADAPLDMPVAAPFSDEELAQWDEAWQAWDGFATWVIMTLAVSAPPEVVAALAETLLESRYDLRDALASDERDQDQLRALFLKTWERLAPVIHQIEPFIPGADALRYAAFISAGDALQTLDLLAPHVGMRMDRDTFRSLARMLIPGVTATDLDYDTAVDPELRRLLGLDPQFEGHSGDEHRPNPQAEPSADNGPWSSFLSWFISSARAAQVPTELANQLDGWVPERSELGIYLQAMAQLLDAISRAERDKGKVPAEHIELYDTLLRATAWQETCWRQYIELDGTVRPIRSPAGSIGLMQINVHVWRGVYDVELLAADVTYNARAGNEVLVHYLVDYAIKKGEHEITGNPSALARAAYAMYNGGPRQLSRYRDPKSSAALKQIDQAFWKKYQAIEREGAAAVRQCWGPGG